MSSRLYKYISLVGAKLVGRRHPRDVEPPGLKELKDAFVSKSDAAITCRPDFDPIAEDLLAVSGGMSASSNDFLNSAVGTYGSDDVVFFSNLAPVTWRESSSIIGSSQSTSGTVSTTDGSTEIVGSGTSWLTTIWRGCLIEINDSGTYYVIESVNSNTRITVDTAMSSTASGLSYKIYRTHSKYHGDYKLNIQPFTSGIIYSNPTITIPVNANNICGPFHSSIVETSTTNDWVRIEIDDATSYSIPQFSFSSATNGTSVAMFAVSVGGTSYDYVLVSTGDPSDAANWDVRALPGDFTSTHAPLVYNSSSGAFLIGGKKDSTNKAAVAVSTNNGSSWSVREIDVTGTEICALVASGVWVAAKEFAETSNIHFSSDDFLADKNTLDTGLTATSGGFGIKGPASGDGIGVISFSSSAWYSTTFPSLWAEVSHGVTGEGLAAGAYNSTLDRFAYCDQSGSSVFYSDAGGIAAVNSREVTGSSSIVDVSSSYDGLFFASQDGGDFDILKTTNLVSFTSEYNDNSGNANSYLAGQYLITYNMRVCPCEIADYTNGGILVSNKEQTTTTWGEVDFSPLSSTIRAVTHSVLDGYVVLLGTREYDSDEDTWNYYPRRIRWSVPLTYSDFSGTGSGSAELDGNGAVLDSRPVNGRIVTFESSAIGAISPRGYATDPWEYDIIKQNIRAVSNPVVVDDMCYFIDDSGLLRATNGITVESPPFSFDLSEYDDFNSDSPVWLTYSPELESLVVFNPSDTNRWLYLVETESGTVSRFKLAQVDGANPKSVVCVENSSDRRMMVTYNPISTDTDTLVCAELSTGETITGIDEWTSSAGDDTYHYTDVQTGEVYIVPEGNKTGIKHLIVRTYCDGTDEDTNPRLVVQCKSLEDSDWHDNGDDNGTITVDTDSCDGTSTAWSNTIGAAGSTVYTTPCLATQARIYVGSTLQTEGTNYTITDTKEITFGAATSDVVYAYWENQPEVKVRAYDLIETTDGYHLITAVTNSVSMTLDHYLSSESDATATHHPSVPIPVGEGEVKIGLTKLTEGVKLRLLVFHRSDGDATVTKITGVSVGHVPAGNKIVEP